MKENFSRALSRILAYEGGKVNDPQDPGGKTNQGITQATYNAWLHRHGRDSFDVFSLPVSDRDAIYKSQYWDMICADELPAGVDLVLFDAAVNSGCGQAVKWLQATMQPTYAGQLDGVMGTKTLDIVNQFSAQGGDVDLIEGVCSRRLAMLQRLKTWSRFGKGWHARIANVQKTALAWSETAPEPDVPDLSSVGGSAKAQVNDLKPPIVSQVTAHMTTVATGAGTVASQTASQVQGVEDIFGWAKYVFGGLTVLGAVAGMIAFISTKLNEAATSGTATAVVDLEADTQLEVALPAPSHAAPAGAKP